MKCKAWAWYLGCSESDVTVFSCVIHLIHKQDAITVSCFTQRAMDNIKQILYNVTLF
jgi:hypothetical protein